MVRRKSRCGLVCFSCIVIMMVCGLIAGAILGAEVGVVIGMLPGLIYMGIASSKVYLLIRYPVCRFLLSLLSLYDKIIVAPDKACSGRLRPI